MNLRKHRRTKLKLLHRALRWRWTLQRDLAQWEPSWYYDDDDDHYSCTRCGGEGYCEVDDPFWDECDEFGYGPCNACGGSGSRADQTVF